MSHKLFLTLALLLNLVLTACLTEAQPEDMQVSYYPVFESASCPFPVPEEYNPQCGFLHVPENRDHPAGRWISLGVAIFHTTDPSPEPDPVIHLAGGPGASALNNALPILRKGGDLILEHRDYILFDQRGTMFSDPYLYCQPYDEYLWRAHEQELTMDEFNKGALPWLAGCVEQWRAQGADLSAYTSAESAADVNDLRLALGYDQVNLYATSYGTRLALTVLRDYPDGIRSVILDSVEPLQVELGFEDLPFNANRALQLVFSLCAADSSCARYGDLEEKYYRLVDQLEQAPLVVPLYGPYRSENPYNVYLDGNLFMDVIFGMQYSMDTIASIPYLIDSSFRGEYQEITALAGGAIGSPLSTGLFWTTMCREEIPFASRWREIIKGISLPVVLKEHFSSSYILDVCALWNVPPADPVENKAVTSDIPVILFSGSFDPITPPAWAKMAARTLSAHYFYEFPNRSHGVMRSDPCAMQMGMAFLEDPSHAPDSSCMPTDWSLVFR